MLKKRRAPEKHATAAEETPKAPEKQPEPVPSGGPVSMVRSAEAAAGGPTSADVHPDQVAEWLSAGWKIKT